MENEDTLPIDVKGVLCGSLSVSPLVIFQPFPCNIMNMVSIMEYGSTPYVGMAWEKNGVHI